MKDLIVIGLFCITLVFSACSSGFKGGYVGQAEISTFVRNDTTKGEKEVFEKVLALITPEGGAATIDFSDTTSIRNCKLQLKSLAERPKYDAGQTCEVVVNGATEKFTVDGISLTNGTDSGGKMYINVEGWTYATGRNHVRINFSGERYEKK